MSLAQKTEIIGGPIQCPQPKKTQNTKKTLKTEHKKLSLSEGRAYKFLQKFGEKKA